MLNRKKAGLLCIAVFGIKASLSVLLGTGFDPLLVCLNGTFLIVGVTLLLWR